MSMTKGLPKRENPTERLISLGSENLSNVELLTILLKSSELAEQVISIEESGVAYLTDCSFEELSEVKGVGQAKSCTLLAAVELGKRITQKPKNKGVCIMCSQDIADYFMASMRYLKNEHFKVMLLNTKNEVIAVNTVAIGNINSAIVDPREVFRPAIKRGAASVVLVHNHPSGSPEPSQADVDLTKRLAGSGLILGIKVMITS